MKRTITHYEAVCKLGAGGSGVVYLANDTQLMRPCRTQNPQARRRAHPRADAHHRPSRGAHGFRHRDPNVCAIYEVGEEGEEAFIVMQYVPGQSLDKLIAKGPASLDPVLSVGIQIADGLSPPPTPSASSIATSSPPTSCLPTAALQNDAPRRRL